MSTGVLQTCFPPEKVPSGPRWSRQDPHEAWAEPEPGRRSPAGGGPSPCPRSPFPQPCSWRPLPASRQGSAPVLRLAGSVQLRRLFHPVHASPGHGHLQALPLHIPATKRGFRGGLSPLPQPSPAADLLPSGSLAAAAPGRVRCSPCGDQVQKAPSSLALTSTLSLGFFPGSAFIKRFPPAHCLPVSREKPPPLSPADTFPQCPFPEGPCVPWTHHLLLIRVHRIPLLLPGLQIHRLHALLRQKQKQPKKSCAKARPSRNRCRPAEEPGARRAGGAFRRLCERFKRSFAAQISCRFSFWIISTPEKAPLKIKGTRAREKRDSNNNRILPFSTGA